MDHHELMKLRASVEADLRKATKENPVFLDELGAQYEHDELAMIELVKSLKEERLHGLQLEPTADGRVISWFK
jgi:hypothetical protein